MVEVTPQSIRLRKKILNKAAREKEAKRVKQMMQDHKTNKRRNIKFDVASFIIEKYTISFHLENGD